MRSKLLSKYDTDSGLGHERLGRQLAEGRIECIQSSGEALARAAKIQAELAADTRQTLIAANAAVVVEQQVVSNVIPLKPNQPTSPFYPEQSVVPTASELGSVELGQLAMADDARRQAEDSYGEAA